MSDGVFDFTPCGNCVFKPSLDWEPGTRDDLIKFDHDRDMPSLLADLKVGSQVSPAIRNELISVIQDHWDCFAKEGVKRKILGYEFAIDTGNSAPVCCRKPAYGPHESKIIMEQVNNLLANKWIRRCKGAWGSLIVLAAKPHQEHVTNIEDFIWRMCVSYRKLNEVTKPFQFPIPRCDDSIISLEQGPSRIYQMSMDADSGYHQVGVREVDQDKLAFFAPDNHKYTFEVMPFGPCNAPPFYTAMMLDFKEEWDALFVIKVAELKTVDGKTVRVEGILIFLGTEKLYYGSRAIIDDILIWTSHLRLTILYFRCVCMVFQKYRVSFKLKKCDFLKDRTEYVGYDVLSSGNSPAQSKFSMINDWQLPTTGQSLHSFIGLVNFYHRFAPYLEIWLKPLRKLCKSYFRKPIPSTEWTPTKLVQLFADIKVSITSGPILARYDSEKPTFLKTDWSADGMAWILMQPADDEESKRATELLLMCDCSAVREVLEYEGSISYICRWSQELLGYHFACIHRNNRMMVDVDSLTHRFGKSIATYLAVAYLLHNSDREARPTAYDKDTFCDTMLKKLPHGQSPLHIITESCIQHVCLYQAEAPPSSSPRDIPCLVTAPLQLVAPPIQSSPSSTDQSMSSFEASHNLSLSALVIDDCLSQCSSWFSNFNAATHFWSTHRVFTKQTLLDFHHLLFSPPSSTTHSTLFTNHSSLPIRLGSTTLIDWTCSAWDGFGLDWIDFACQQLAPAFAPSSALQICCLWIPHHYCHGISVPHTLAILRQHITSDHWHFTCNFESSTHWGASVATTCFVVIITTRGFDMQYS